MNSTIKNLILTSTPVAIKIEGEVVVGIFLQDHYATANFAFKSIICPQFVQEENERSGANLTGTYNEVSDCVMNEGGLLITFDEPEADVVTYRRVRVIRSKEDMLDALD